MIYSYPRLYDYLSADFPDRNELYKSCLKNTKEKSSLKEFVLGKLVEDIKYLLISSQEFVDYAFLCSVQMEEEKPHLLIDSPTNFAMDYLSNNFAKAVFYDSQTQKYFSPLENENLEKYISLLPPDFFVFNEKGNYFVREDYFAHIKRTLLSFMKNYCKQETDIALKGLNEIEPIKRQELGLKLITDLKTQFSEETQLLLDKALLLSKRMELLSLGWTKQNIEKFICIAEKSDLKNFANESKM